MFDRIRDVEMKSPRSLLKEMAPLSALGIVRDGRFVGMTLRYGSITTNPIFQQFDTLTIKKSHVNSKFHNVLRNKTTEIYNFEATATLKKRI